MTEQVPSNSLLARALERVAVYRKDPTTLLPYARSMIALADEIERLAAELEQAEEIRSDREILIELMRGALGVSIEPHQTLSERLVEAAGKANTDWACPHYKPRGKGCTECSAPEPPAVESFVVKHYSVDERPTIKGNGFDGLEVGHDRQEAEEFVSWINIRLSPEAQARAKELLAAIDARRTGSAPPPEPSRLTGVQCDEIISALASHEWTGFTREDIRLIATTIEFYRASPTKSVEDGEHG